MSEFNNRIEVQRQILWLVNRKAWPNEALNGLSGKAIERWTSRNAIDPHARLVELLRSAAARLFFLANHSQEQVTDEYQLRSHEIKSIMHDIAAVVQSGE